MTTDLNVIEKEKEIESIESFKNYLLMKGIIKIDKDKESK